MPSYRSRLLAVLLALPLSAPADTYPRQPGFHPVHYTFRLTLTDQSDEIDGEATVEVAFPQTGLASIALDLASLNNAKGMTVTAVTSSGAPVPFTHADDRLSIALIPSPQSGQRRAFTIRYHGVPKSGLRIGLNKFGERCFFSENWPDHARQWLPMLDHPSEKATSEFLITAPARYQVVANGVLVEELDLADGSRLTHWKQSVPISSWLNAVGVAQFASRHFGAVQGIPLQTWVFHQERDAGIVTFDTPAAQAMEFYTAHIGPFSYEKLANVEAAGLNGGTEHASAIFYGEKAVNGKPATNLVAHEIAHQWFGDSVTEKDWDDVWLSEGFATYFTLLNTEHYQGRDAFVAGLNRSRDAVLALEKKMPGVPVIHNNLADMTKVLNRLIYEKGGWTLHMLRSSIGDDAFWAGIRDYYATYRNTNVSTAEFRAVMERHAGRDLQWFFDQWLRRPGSPVIEGTWRYDAAAQRVSLTLSQTQPGSPYRLPIEIGVGDRVVPLELTQATQTFDVPAATKPQSITLDPRTTLLASLHISASSSGESGM